MNIEFRRAAPEDWEIIQSMAYAIWPVTYGHVLPSGQLEYMLELIYREESIKQQMDRQHQFIIGHQSGEPLGFASFEEQYKTTTNLMVHKLYILPSYQGKGIGKEFLNYITMLASQSAHDTVMLKVFNKNQNAIRFYQHQGFHSIGEEVTELGRGYMVLDVVMIKEIQMDKNSL